MTLEEFKALDNYSCSVPTGFVVGKRWKRSKCYTIQTDNPKDWWLGTYILKDGVRNIRWSEIEILSDLPAFVRDTLYAR